MELTSVLVALGLAFLAVGVFARLGVRIGLPTIPLFILTGVLFGPGVPELVLFKDPGQLRLLSQLGLIFLLFYLGLQFNGVDPYRGRWAHGTAIHLGLAMGGGLLFGFALGWGTREALVLAGVIGLTSPAIVTKVMVDTGRLGNPESTVVLGILLGEELVLAPYLVLLEPLLGHTTNVGVVVATAAGALAFILVLIAVGRWGSHVVGEIVHTTDDELLVITFVGIAVLAAGVARELGVSIAIGALMVGLALGASRRAQRIRMLLHPLRYTFAAIFFFSVGLNINPSDLAKVAGPVVAAAGATLVISLAEGITITMLHGFGRRQAADISLTLLARGELALVLASLTAGAGLDRRVVPFIGGYVLILATLAPLAAARSGALAHLLPRRLFTADRHPP